MFDTLRSAVFSGCSDNWDRLLSVLLLVFLLEVIAALIEAFVGGVRH